MSTAASLSVYEMGKSTLVSTPDFGLLSKPTTTVDVTRLQTELHTLHRRLALLEHAALNPVSEPDLEQSADSGDSAAGSSVSRVVFSAVSPAPEGESDGGGAPKSAGQGNVVVRSTAETGAHNRYFRQN